MNNAIAMKGTKHFKVTIQSYLDKVAAKDPLFAKTMEKEDKNIDDCITYILNTVQRTGANGFLEGEIYGMALHYYDEDKLDIGQKIEADVIVNHHVELTKEEKKELKEQAKAEVFQEEYTRLRAKPKFDKVKHPAVKKAEDLEGPAQVSLF